MSTDEVIDLLTLMASYDRRKVGEADVAAWYAAMGDLAFSDSRDAVIAHYRDSTEWIMPAHVRKRVAAVRSERLSAAGNLEDLIPEELADRPLEYAARLKQVTEAVRDGEPAAKAIGGAR